jgi:catalase
MPIYSYYLPQTLAAFANKGGGVNFYPNDRTGTGAPAPMPEIAEPPMPILGEAWIKAYDTQDEDNFTQAGTLYRLMSNDQKNPLTGNIANGLIHATASVQERMLAQFATADADYAVRVKQAMNARR